MRKYLSCSLAPDECEPTDMNPIPIELGIAIVTCCIHMKTAITAEIALLASSVSTSFVMKFNIKVGGNRLAIELRNIRIPMIRAFSVSFLNPPMSNLRFGFNMYFPANIRDKNRIYIVSAQQLGIV